MESKEPAPLDNATHDAVISAPVAEAIVGHPTANHKSSIESDQNQLIETVESAELKRTEESGTTDEHEETAEIKQEDGSKESQPLAETIVGQGITSSNNTNETAQVNGIPLVTPALESPSLESPSLDQSTPTLESASQATHTYSTRSKDKPTDSKSKLKQIAHNVIVQPRLKPLPFKDFSYTELNSVAVTKINDIQFYQSEDHPVNKRGFKYKPCRPNGLFKSNLYSTTESAPFKVRPSYFDRAPGVLFDEDVEKVTTLGGWRSARCNTGVREGNYYFEFNIIRANESNSKAHVRIGIARKEASVEAPVGFDGYGYGLRDVHGEFMTLSRPRGTFVEGGFTTGDTIGVLIELPSLSTHRAAIDAFCETYKSEVKVVKKRKKTQLRNDFVDSSVFNSSGNIVRDQVPIKYRNSLYYEQYEYTNNKIMDHLLNPVVLFGERAVLQQEEQSLDFDKIPKIPGSKIILFKNGVEQSQKIEDLYSFLPTTIENEDIHLFYNTTQQQNPNYRNTDDGSLGYYPVISVFQGGIASLNAGPEFKYPIGVRSLSERYDESVIEEWYWDLIDEVEAEYLDSFD